MKKLLIALLIISSFATYADDKSRGCGLGTLIAPKKSLLSTSIADTTDYYIPSRASATTSGTSGCAKHDLVKNEFFKEHFIHYTQDELKIAIALNDGQYLSSLARVYGCENSITTHLGSVLQKNYSSLFQTTNGNAREIAQRIENLVTNDKQLNKNCVLF